MVGDTHPSHDLGHPETGPLADSLEAELELCNHIDTVESGDGHDVSVSPSDPEEHSIELGVVDGAVKPEGGHPSVGGPVGIGGRIAVKRDEIVDYCEHLGVLELHSEPLGLMGVVLASTYGLLPRSPLGVLVGEEVVESIVGENLNHGSWDDEGVQGCSVIERGWDVVLHCGETGDRQSRVDIVLI